MTEPVLNIGDPVLFPKMEERMILKQLENTKRLEEFKYFFNENGQLRHTETNQPFVFNQYNNAMNLNHQWYTAFGTVLAEYVYELLEKEYRLKRLYIPVNATMDEPRSFCFVSEGALDNPSKLIVLLQDRGVSRAGTWSQQLIVHDCLDTGTQMPYIKQALRENYEVMVLNPNDNFMLESVEQHTFYVWDHFISKCAPMSVAFIAHGYGGLAVVNLLTEYSDVMSKVYAVAFINSNHDVDHQNVNLTERNWIAKNCRTWSLSAKPLDKPVASMKMDCVQVSAGTENHDLAPASCFHSIFKFLKKASNAQKTKRLTRSPIVTRSSSKNN
ncbi:cotranscriptional regulator FAM172A-like [Leucoraja erinacea]|uniref:cotranscriptional regulator FAM172A-like n=1 Tax=Leucoraja erinaceus TaxID=7782 RepID=UPI002454F02B|nr:cotranscriptional regulator FAM172A-like [Leucoraja erinacea]